MALREDQLLRLVEGSQRERGLGELPGDLSEILRHVEASYPQEGCGLLLRAEHGGAWRVRPLRNAYDRHHALDPVRFPRTSRTAYLFDPIEWLRVNEEAEVRGERVVCVFHSHVDAGAFFSAEDRALAAPGGQPILPGVSYLVIAVEGGRATEARLYGWNLGELLERPVPLGR